MLVSLHYMKNICYATVAESGWKIVWIRNKEKGSSNGITTEGRT